MDVVDANKSIFEAFVLRPATFMSEQPVSPTTPTQKRHSIGHAHGTGATIEPAKVGKAMVMIASDGWSHHIIENETIAKLGS